MELIKGKKYKIKSEAQILEMYPDYKGIPHGWNTDMREYLGCVIDTRQYEPYRSTYGYVIRYSGYAWHYTLLEEVSEVTVTQRLLKFARESYGTSDKMA